MIQTAQSLTTVDGAVIGAGAQGQIAAAIWRRAEQNRTLAFLDDDSRLWDSKLMGIPVVGPVAMLREINQRAIRVIVAIGNNCARTVLAREVVDYVAAFATVVDPTAAILPGATLGAGVFVGPQAVVHVGAQVADHVVVNTAAVVEHHCVVERGASLAPGVKMGGRTYIEQHAFICTGATIIGRTRIGEGAIVGAGAVVTCDVPARTIVWGCPAKVVREVTDEDWTRLF